MSLQLAINSVLKQLHLSLENLTDEQYCFPAKALSQATVGQHLRHIIEFFQELYKGYDSGVVNYDQRSRDHRIETDKQFALQQLCNICDDLSKPDKDLVLVTSFPLQNISNLEFQTNYNRELLYNLEHTVHHMALIRVGIEAISLVQLPVQFGIAESTLQSRIACAQ